MNASLARWIGDAEALRHLQDFQVDQANTAYAHIRSRADDYYLSLVGALFERMRGVGDAVGWARIGNAFAQFATDVNVLDGVGVARGEPNLFAAAAFYCGGYPASAHLVARTGEMIDGSDTYRACADLLIRPRTFRSDLVRGLMEALRVGNLQAIAQAAMNAQASCQQALMIGPLEYVPARLLQQLLDRFAATNIRSVLPNGGTDFWAALVASFLDRRPAVWEFFPSQIEAIQRGVLGDESFSLQMPTGAGKTALCETLLYWHAQRDASTACVFLVPYRSLASELRSTVVKRLNAMGISSRCAYGGTVPSGDEVKGLDETRVIVATPETLSGLLSAENSFFNRVSLVICDEGHLLDGGGRGVGLELLLARMRARTNGPPRFVFVSAIVPNIEEINAWLGGSAQSVVRSDYRPALAEFAVLRPDGTGASMTVDLEMHPHEVEPTRFRVSGFLRGVDFQFQNPETRRRNTYPFGSVKTQAIAAARKALGMGACAVFATNKRGNQGAVGLAEELLEQLDRGLPLPQPRTYANVANLDAATQYLELEYGNDWIGTRTVVAGAVLHHGDIPQETREVLETLLRRGHVRLVICTSTLAEGVNMPIRTLVLYSLQRREMSGTTNLLTRDIKNLVGRAGRAGSTTKGLVICANPDQWPQLVPVAQQAAGERVNGALFTLLQNLQQELIVNNLALTNQILEVTPGLEELVDGVDATLIDLAAEEVGEEALVQLAVELAEQTFASRQVDAAQSALLQQVFELRARSIAAVRTAGRLGWIRETGARIRLLESVETGLMPRRPEWSDVTDPIDPQLVATMLDWAWTNREVQEAIARTYRVDPANIESVRPSFFRLVNAWLAGQRYPAISTAAGRTVDEVLGIYSGVVSFVLQTLVEQGVALLAKLLEAQGQTIADAVMQFPEHLRFGVPSAAARMLAAGGLRHRSASVALAEVDDVAEADEPFSAFFRARAALLEDEAEWRTTLSDLVVNNAIDDLASMVGDVPGVDQ